MVGTAGSDRDQSKLFEQQKGKEPEKPNEGEPDTSTRLGEHQARRRIMREQPDSLSTDGFTRWDKT